MQEIFVAAMVAYILFAMTICIRRLMCILPWFVCCLIALLFVCSFFLWIAHYIYHHLHGLLNPQHMFTTFKKIIDPEITTFKEIIDPNKNIGIMSATILKKFIPGLDVVQDTEKSIITSKLSNIMSSIAKMSSVVKMTGDIALRLVSKLNILALSNIILHFPLSILRFLLQSLLSVCIFIKLDKVDSYLSHEDESAQFSVYRVCADIHQNLKQWLVAAVTAASINTLLYLACFIYFQAKSILIGSILYGFSGLVPFIGDAIAWSFVLSTIHESTVCNIIHFLSCLAFINIITSMLTPLFVGKRLNISFIFIILGMIVHSYIFGAIGIVFNLPLCVISRAMLTEARNCIKSST